MQNTHENENSADFHEIGDEQHECRSIEGDDDSRVIGESIVPSHMAREGGDRCLSASFDLSMLNRGDNSVTSVNELKVTSSWDDGDMHRSDSCKRSRGRIFEEETSKQFTNYALPRTVRKARRSTTDSPRASLRLDQHGSYGPTTDHRYTPLSVRRHRTPSRARRSPMRRNPPRSQLYHFGESSSSSSALPYHPMAAPYVHNAYDSEDSKSLQHRKPKVSIGTTVTAASTVLETTTDTLDSAETLESNTPFRFTSFPASLPRINSNSECPPTVRKRMSFDERGGDDDTNNTSVSSLLLHDDSDDDDFPDTPRARLNFMQSPTSLFAAMPKHHAQNNRTDSCLSPLLPPVASDEHEKIGSSHPDLEMRLDSVQCSPIPGSTDDIGSPHRSLHTSNSSTATCRPLPDLAAFEGERSSSSRDDSGLSSGTSSPLRLRCPPTPVRTPAWAHTIKDRRPNRSNSLIATKLLATCDESNDFSSQESSERDPIQWTTSRHTTTTGNNNNISSNFESISLLGSGTFADVYKVKSRTTGNLYALKKSRKMFRGQRDRERALKEVQCMQQLQASPHSPYLLFFYQAWQQDGHFFCLTELCCRSTCQDLIHDFRRQHLLTRRRIPSIETLPDNDGDRYMPEETIWKIAHDVAAGLCHVHSHGLVHNDIKSSNIFLTASAEYGAFCKIGDFGLTREAGFDDDEGDQKYMPTEVLDSGGKESSSDIFSFGLMLYELAAKLSFELPSDGPRWHEIRRKGHSLEVPQGRGVELRRLIVTMINPASSQRPTASAVMDSKPVASTLQDKGFLSGYVADIGNLDRIDEERNGVLSSDSNETPAPTRRRTCSPLLSGGEFPAVPDIRSPEAALS